MKKYIFHTLIAGAAVFFAGCADEIEQYTPKRSGEEIVFGGRATYELNENKSHKAPQTRTVYTGTFLGADGKAWTSGTKFEVIHWVSGDKVRIFSAQAAGTTVADYTVNVNDADATGATELTKIGAAGLQWSDQTSYDFYAVYPSPHQYPLKDGTLDQDVSDAVLNNKAEILGRIPAVQECLGTPSHVGTTWTLSPKMEYAYMVAHQKVENANKTGAEIYLNFVPIATAVEIELVNKSGRALELANILVSSATDGTALTGDFTADLSVLPIGSADNIVQEIPTDEFITAVSNTGTQISIPTYQGKGGLTGDPISLADGEIIKFTLFMLPNQNIEDLKITLVGIEGNRVGTTSGITITKHKKTFLNQMPISIKQGDYDQSRWIEFLPDNAYLKGLSIPGAGGASSGYVYSGSSVQDYLEQSLTIEQLWAQGIRCFEFTVECDNVDENGDISDNIVYCNAQTTGKTLTQCVQAVKDKLCANPNEFAMVIITYQQNEGWNMRADNGTVSQSRNPARFMKQLNNFWDKVKVGTAVGAWTVPTGVTKPADVTLGTELYSSTLTVNNARGKLFCIARPTSLGEDNYPMVNDNKAADEKVTSTTYATIETPDVTNEDILVIHGWGALKDKWYARGFSSNPYKRGVGNDAYKAWDKSALGGDDGRPGRPFDASSNPNDDFTTLVGYKEGTSKLALTPSFYYSTINSENNGVLQDKKAWVQEWARVVNMPGGVFTLKDNTGRGTTLSPYNGIYLYWAESLTEKKNHIKECLDFALAQIIKLVGGKDENGNAVINEESADGVIFINSLCGYYINATKDNQNSALPNSLSDLGLAKNYFWSSDYGYSAITGSNSKAGMCGDIANFATDINGYFYELLQDVTTNPNFKPGPMGIILMDRVSSNKDDDGAKIPAIIIANNFQHALPSAPVTLSLPRRNLEEGDKIAAPARRATETSKEGIVWE